MITAKDLRPSAYVVMTPEQFHDHIDDDLQIHHVIEYGHLSYNVGTAVAYLYRAGKKPGNLKGKDIRKAIKHLNFELSAL